MPDTPRYLSRRGIPSYVTDPSRAMRGEPEACSESDLALLTEQAERRAREARIQAWTESRARLEREVNWLRSQRFQKDVTRALHALERQIGALGRKIDAG